MIGWKCVACSFKQQGRCSACSSCHKQGISSDQGSSQGGSGGQAEGDRRSRASGRCFSRGNGGDSGLHRRRHGGRLRDQAVRCNDLIDAKQVLTHTGAASGRQHLREGGRVGHLEGSVLSTSHNGVQEIHEGSGGVVHKEVHGIAAQRGRRCASLRGEHANVLLEHRQQEVFVGEQSSRRHVELAEQGLEGGVSGGSKHKLHTSRDVDGSVGNSVDGLSEDGVVLQGVGDVGAQAGNRLSNGDGAGGGHAGSHAGCHSRSLTRGHGRAHALVHGGDEHLVDDKGGLVLGRAGDNGDHRGRLHSIRVHNRASARGASLHELSNGGRSIFHHESERGAVQRGGRGGVHAGGAGDVQLQHVGGKRGVCQDVCDGEVQLGKSALKGLVGRGKEQKIATGGQRCRWKGQGKRG